MICIATSHLSSKKTGSFSTQQLTSLNGNNQNEWPTLITAEIVVYFRAEQDLKIVV